MRLLFISIFFAITLFAFSTKKNKSIYSKEIVYTYKYSISKNGKTETGKIYLGCLGKLWSIKEQEQFAVIWTKAYKTLLEKNFNTGVIEDSCRIFMHPPRKDEFSILEYSPFPQIKYPLQIGNKWEWKLTLGKYWANEELNVLASDTLKYNYETKSQKQKYYGFSRSTISYFEIDSYSINPKFDSKFTGYFNEEYGFIYFHFYNIDNSEITLELTDISSFKEIPDNPYINFSEKQF